MAVVRRMARPAEWPVIAMRSWCDGAEKMEAHKEQSKKEKRLPSHGSKSRGSIYSLHAQAVRNNIM